jgi:HJR/Mrr/RecB family endonuclease
VIIAGRYSFNKGLETIKEKYAPLLNEVEDIIVKIDASKCKTKKSKEKTMPGRMLYSPRKLNMVFCSSFLEKDWSSPKVKCEYSIDFYTNGY